MSPVSTVNEFIGGMKGFEHSGWFAGVKWIELHNGVMVSTKPGFHDGNITTYRVRFPDADILITWGHCWYAPASGVTLPEWRFVVDRKK